MVRRKLCLIRALRALQAGTAAGLLLRGAAPLRHHPVLRPARASSLQTIRPLGTTEALVGLWDREFAQVASTRQGVLTVLRLTARRRRVGRAAGAKLRASWDRAVGGVSTSLARAVGGVSTSLARAVGGGSTSWVRAVPHRSPNVSRWAVMGGPFRADAQVMGAVAIRTALVLGVGPPALKEPQRVRGENLRLSSLHNFSTL